MERTTINLHVYASPRCTMERPLSLDTLLQSCTVLFGHELDISRDFLDYLQISGVKSAYRKRARETHPDLAVGIAGDICREHSDGFHCVQESYENLKLYLKKRDDRLLRQPVSHTPNEAFRKDRSDGSLRPVSAAADCADDSLADQDIYESESECGCFPSRKLMLGDLLYFAQVAGWQDIIHALIWQKASRPRLGDLGCSLGWLQPKDILRIFQSHRLGKRFGEIAVHLGLLDRQQCDQLVFYQRCRQQKIGRYFVEKGFLTDQELLMYINMLKRHNALYPACA